MEEQLLMARRLAAIVRYKPAPSRPVLPLALFCSLALVFLTGNGAAVDGGNAPAPRPSAADFPVPAGSGAPQLQESDADLNTQFVPLDLSKVAEEPSHKSWPALPKGLQTLNGVPFQIDGWVQLAAVRDDATGTGFPVELTGLRVGRQIDRVHLINFTEYFTGYDTPVACLAFRYTNGEWRSAEMRYGVHTRDWYSGTGPAVGLLTDPDSRIAWTGRSRDAAHFGKLLRLYHTAFENPLPAQPVESIEIISSLSAAIPTILAITVEEAATRLHDSTEEEGTSQPGDLGTLKLKSIDAARGEPVAHARYTIKTGPAGSGMTLGTFRSDATGEATVLFPPGPWSQLMITAQASDDLIGTSTVQLPAPRRSKLPAFLIPQYGGSRWPPRSLDAGETLESTVEMVRTESMGARVIDKNGQPAAGIRIVIQSFTPDLNGSLQAVELDSVVTSQDGVWTSSYIPVGTQHLRLRLIPPDGGELEIELDWSHPSKLPPFPRTALETETAVIGLTP
jgi:hypothetical protein